MGHSKSANLAPHKAPLIKETVLVVPIGVIILALLILRILTTMQFLIELF